MTRETAAFIALIGKRLECILWCKNSRTAHISGKEVQWEVYHNKIQKGKKKCIRSKRKNEQLQLKWGKKRTGGEK